MWLSNVPIEFDYSPEFVQLIRDLSAPKSNWPNFQQYISDNLAGRESRYARFRLETVPEIEHHCGDLSQKQVLDFGCGTGATTVALAERARHVVGFDIDSFRLSICNRRAMEHGLQDRISASNDLERVARERGSFDLVVLNGVLEHIPASEPGLRNSVLARVASVVSPAGYIFINDTPNRLLPFDLHTTQLWWIPWTTPGSSWAYRRALEKQRFFASTDLSAGPRGMEEAGAWGLTYWDIAGVLRSHGFACLNLAKGHDRRLRYRPARANRYRGVFETVVYVIGPRLLRAPLTAFMPNLTNLVFQRQH